MTKLKERTLISVLKSINLNCNNTADDHVGCVQLAFNAEIPISDAKIIIDMLRHTIRYAADGII